MVQEHSMLCGINIKSRFLCHETIDSDTMSTTYEEYTKNTQRIHKEYTKNTQRIHRYNPTNITNELIAFLTTRMRPLNASEELLGQICNLGALQRLPEESLMTLFAVILSSARGDNDKIWAFQYRVCRWICRSMSFHFMLVKLCPFY